MPSVTDGSFSIQLRKSTTETQLMPTILAVKSDDSRSVGSNEIQVSERTDPQFKTNLHIALSIPERLGD